MPNTPAPDEIIFEDPPPPGIPISQRGTVRARWKLALMERPGEWARVPIAYASAKVVEGRSPGFELVGRTVDGKRVVYGRYVGDSEVAS